MLTNPKMLKKFKKNVNLKILLTSDFEPSYTATKSRIYVNIYIPYEVIESNVRGRHVGWHGIGHACIAMRKKKKEERRRDGRREG